MIASLINNSLPTESTAQEAPSTSEISPVGYFRRRSAHRTDYSPACRTAESYLCRPGAFTSKTDW